MHDPPPAGPLGWLGRLWVAGAAALVAVIVLTVVLGGGALSPLAALFVWGSSAAFSVWLLHEHVRRLPRPQRLALFGFCVAALVVLLVVLVAAAV